MNGRRLCAHEALWLHYATAGAAIGFTAGIALAAATVLAFRAVCRHRAVR